MAEYRESSKECWFCSDKAIMKVPFQFCKYERSLGQIGSKKHYKTVNVMMCKTCYNQLLMQDKKKDICYKTIVTISMLVVTYICITNSYFFDMSIVERVAMGLISGFFIGTIPAWFISKYFISIDPKTTIRAMNGFYEHPEVKRVCNEGYDIE